MKKFHLFLSGLSVVTGAFGSPLVPEARPPETPFQSVIAPLNPPLSQAQKGKEAEKEKVRRERNFCLKASAGCFSLVGVMALSGHYNWPGDRARKTPPIRNDLHTPPGLKHGKDLKFLDGLPWKKYPWYCARLSVGWGSFVTGLFFLIQAVSLQMRGKMIDPAYLTFILCPGSAYPYYAYYPYYPYYPY
jgi:hypothetical protein